MCFDNWGNNKLQFARLLCELKAALGDNIPYEDLCISMDLPKHRIEELFYRAEEVFEEAKADLEG